MRRTRSDTGGDDFEPVEQAPQNSASTTTTVVPPASADAATNNNNNNNAIPSSSTATQNSSDTIRGTSALQQSPEPSLTHDVVALNRQRSFAEGDENVHVYHSTSYENWVSIQTDPRGINRMARRAIHLYAGPNQPARTLDSEKQKNKEDDANSSKSQHEPKKNEVLIYIDKKLALADGLKFEPGMLDGETDSKTIITRGVGSVGNLPMKYFEKVVDAKTGVVLWRNENLGQTLVNLRALEVAEIERANKCPRIDIHTHVLPRNLDLCQRFRESGYIFLKMHEGEEKADMFKTRRDGGADLFRQVWCNCYDSGKRVEEMEATKVDVQALSTVPVMFSYWTKDRRDARDLARYLNDDIAERVREKPSRFLGLGTVAMQFPDLAVEEVRRCMTELNFCGIQIGSHIDLSHPEEKTNRRDMELSDPALHPFWAEAEKLGAAIFVHPWAMLGTEEIKKYWLPWLVGMPAESSRAICHILFSGILDKFPKLRFCFAHGGGSFPYTAGRIDHGFSCRPDLCAIDAARPPSEYLHHFVPNSNPPEHQSSRFWVDSLVHDPRALRFVIDIMGQDRVCLGSDYPFPLGEWRPGEMVAHDRLLNLEVKQKILFENAFDFLGIDEKKAKELFGHDQEKMSFLKDVLEKQRQQQQQEVVKK